MRNAGPQVHLNEDCVLFGFFKKNPLVMLTRVPHAYDGEACRPPVFLKHAKRLASTFGDVGDVM